MIKYISHILFQDNFIMSYSGNKQLDCVLKISFMRYDEENFLFFPLTINGENEDVYVSVRGRLYPKGDITVTEYSGDCDDGIQEQITDVLEQYDFRARMIDFVAETKYDEIIPYQAF